MGVGRRGKGSVKEQRRKEQGEGKWKMLGLEGLQGGVMRGVLGVWDWEEKKGRILPVMVDVRWLEGSDE